jgi:iron complex outermembrane receptor protein
MLASIRGRRAAIATTSLLALAASLALTTGAHAQSAGAQAEDKANTIDEVVVVGTRASLQSAMNRKKRNGTISDSIVAEDISQFPDKNVGEALGRITGVQLARDFGEGNAVSIRGVEPDLNRVEINGMSTLSTADATCRSTAAAAVPTTSANWPRNWSSRSTCSRASPPT